MQIKSKGLKLNRHSISIQLIGSMLLVILVSGAGFIVSDYTGYRIIAFVLLALISILAMFLDILPVLVAALVTSLIWNFFFIPPVFTFHINDFEDISLFLMFFIIASIHAVLTVKIRRAEKLVSEKIEKANTFKLYNTLLNSLSHELRTPIATIVGCIDTLKENRHHLSETQQDELLIALDSASMRLNRQVENLLNMNRLESGLLRLKLDWCDMNEMVFRIVQKYFNGQSQQEIKVSSNEKLPLFRLDQGLVETALLNIIHNAIQHTSENSRIVVSLDHKENLCIIRIEDNGKGFPENEIKRVFEKFYRVPGSGTGGTGLGLTIAKGCVEAHNGSILLENMETGGARFTLNIPAQTSFMNSLKNE